MKQFLEPDLEILKFAVEDIITSSTDEEGIPDVDEGLGWY